MDVAELSFVLPAGSEQASGGNVYNHELVRALALLGQDERAGVPPVRTLDLAEFQRRIASGAAGLYFVDTLNLEQAEVLSGKTPAQHAVLVVHHLPSLEPGVLPEDPGLALERRALPLFDAFLTTSPFTAELLRRRWHAAERIMTVEPGLPAVELGPATTQPPFRALLVANLIRRKGVLELCQALAAETRADDAFELELLGRADLDPAYAEAVGRTIRAAPRLAERVLWRTPVAYSEMGEHYRRASVLLSAASMETFGMALAEARAHGLPILALDGGHARHQFTDGENGHRFARTSELVAQFLRLVRNPAALQALFARARQSASPGPATWDRAARQLLAELARLPLANGP